MKALQRLMIGLKHLVLFYWFLHLIKLLVVGVTIFHDITFTSCMFYVSLRITRSKVVAPVSSL